MTVIANILLARCQSNTNLANGITWGHFCNVCTQVFSWKPFAFDVSIDHPAIYPLEAATVSTHYISNRSLPLISSRMHLVLCSHVCSTTMCNWITRNLSDCVGRCFGRAGSFVGGELCHFVMMADKRSIQNACGPYWLDAKSQCGTEFHKPDAFVTVTVQFIQNVCCVEWPKCLLFYCLRFCLFFSCSTPSLILLWGCVFGLRHGYNSTILISNYLSRCICTSS
jgi:hypothetical protein